MKTQLNMPQQKENSSELIRALIEIVWHFGPKALDGTCCENLSMPEFIALEKVSSSENCPVQDIGAKLGFTKSGATRIVNRLEKKGLVKKHKFANDARVCCITITSKGQQALDSAGIICTFKLEQLVSKVPVNSRKDIKDTLIAMAKALRE
ncbi:MAG TPA: MarR family winged helix-turn-helix transcriptional regulator [Chitinispirillaceae bacterium]|nr:MarR family winged helix-turn-helix transcriptional regulator [Chitinispirillaceae bacterium]